MAKDYYKILGVDKQANKDEIKKAFHKLAHKYHPDKKGGDEAKFKEASEAYQVLSDDTKRRQYDQFGQAGFAGGGQGAGAWDFSNFSGFSNMGGEMEFDLGDIFTDFFSAGGTRVRRGRDISVDIQISFKESVFGTERELLINKLGVCDTCHGKGAAPGSATKTCSVCGGKGKIRETRNSFLGSIATVKTCDKCHGTGQVPEKPCPACAGSGVMKKNESIKVVVPPGIENGEMIRLSGSGEAAVGGLTGDLYVKVHVERHPTLRRDGTNLVTDINIKISDTLLGGEQLIETLDGPLTVKIPEGVAPGEILRVRGKGVPISASKRGDLLIKVNLKPPKKLSRQARSLAEKLKEEGV